MSETTFEVPASPRLDYKSLREYVGHRDQRKIGTAITIQKTEAGFDLRIYFTLFAIIMPNEVQFLYVHYAPNGSPTQEQMAWIAKIANDNGVKDERPRGAYPATPLERDPRA